jgi:hypothetical protein
MNKTETKEAVNLTNLVPIALNEDFKDLTKIPEEENNKKMATTLS